MKNLIKCLGLALGVAVLFTARPAEAKVDVYFNATDRVYQDRYVLALIDTPIIYQGVIYFPNAALTNTYVNTSPPGVVAPRLATPSPGASYLIYSGNPYQIVPPRQ
jgi:hypothetical protein